MSRPAEIAREVRAVQRHGVWIAATVLGAWAASVALGFVLVPNAPVFVPLVILVRAFLNTGLFITAHDAMHGLIAPRHPRLNDAIGAVSLVLFAFLPYRRMKVAHHEHHRIPGRAGDPDYRDAPFWRWFVGFFSGYVSWRIIAANATLQIALLVLGVPVVSWLAVLFVPAFLSALQLFFFGTWLPHRRTGTPFVDDHRARSAAVPPILSFLSCYHFGYHWEHHEEPWVPWWRLPARRALSVVAASRLLSVPHKT